LELIKKQRDTLLKCVQPQQPTDDGTVLCVPTTRRRD